MRKLELLELITSHAVEYKKNAQKTIKRNNHMNDIESGEIIQERHIDAVIVDFINFIGSEIGLDYGLYTKDLIKDLNKDLNNPVMTNNKKLFYCKNCGHNNYTQISENDCYKLGLFGDKNWYRCAECGEIWWTLYFKLNDKNQLEKK